MLRDHLLDKRDPTLGDCILDEVLTEAYQYYERATILPPIGPDSPLHGASSDHKVVLVNPLSNLGAQQSLAKFEMRTRHKFSESGILALSKFLGTYDWSNLHSAVGPDEKLEWLECIVNGAIDTFCPTETVKVKLNSKFYISTKLTLLSDLKSKEYKRNQNSERFRELRMLVKNEKREAMSKRIMKVVNGTAGSHA